MKGERKMFQSDVVEDLKKIYKQAAEYSKRKNHIDFYVCLKSFLEKEAQKGQEAEAGEDSMSDEAEKHTDKVSLFERTERIRRGRLLLGFGTLLFFVTFLVCILPPGKRKR